MSKLAFFSIYVCLLGVGIICWIYLVRARLVPWIIDLFLKMICPNLFRCSDFRHDSCKSLSRKVASVLSYLLPLNLSIDHTPHGLLGCFSIWLWPIRTHSYIFRAFFSRTFPPFSLPLIDFLPCLRCESGCLRVHSADYRFHSRHHLRNTQCRSSDSTSVSVFRKYILKVLINFDPFELQETLTATLRSQSREVLKSSPMTTRSMPLREIVFLLLNINPSFVQCLDEEGIIIVVFQGMRRLQLEEPIDGSSSSSGRQLQLQEHHHQLQGGVY